MVKPVNPQPYIDSVGARTDRRNARAEVYGETQNPLARIFSAPWLWFANIVDRTHAIAGNKQLNAAGGAVSGGFAGTFWGVVGYCLLVAFSLANPATGLFALMALGGLAFGATFGGYSAYREAQANGTKQAGARRADKIAEFGGVLPDEPEVSPGDKETTAPARPTDAKSWEARMTKRVEDKVEGRLPLTPPAVSQTQFAQAVEQSRGLGKVRG